MTAEVIAVRKQTWKRDEETEVQYTQRHIELSTQLNPHPFPRNKWASKNSKDGTAHSTGTKVNKIRSLKIQSFSNDFDHDSPQFYKIIDIVQQDVNFFHI